MRHSILQLFFLTVLCCCVLPKAWAQTPGSLTFNQILLQDLSGHKVRILPPSTGWPSTGIFDWQLAFPPAGVNSGFVQAGDATHATLQWDDVNKYWQAVSGTTVLGSGALNYLPKWNSMSTLTNSLIQDNGNVVSITNGGFYAAGGGAGTPVSGAGSRMMWIPGKSAFRAGNAGTTSWDEASVGVYSFAGGSNTIASGIGSVALGYNASATNASAFAAGISTTASGNSSFAAGNFSTASGNNSFAVGSSPTASADNSAAWGWNTLASGTNSTAGGYYTRATGISSVAIGRLDTASGDNSAAFGVDNTASGVASFVAGVSSTAGGSYSLAAGSHVRANGNTSVALGSYVNSTAGSFIFGDATSFTPLSNTTSNEFLARAANGFRFISTGGSTTADFSLTNGALVLNGTSPAGYSPVNGAGSRMMWIPARSAFRAGRAFGTEWDNSSLGANSIALGSGGLVYAPSGMSLGTNNSVYGDSAIAIGTDNYATGVQAIALGTTNRPSGYNSVTIGQNNNAAGVNGVAIGVNNSASDSSVAIGKNAYALTKYNIALGTNVTTLGNNSVAIGTNVHTNNHNGSIMFGDSTPVITGSITNNEFVVRAAGGLRFLTSGPYANDMILDSGLLVVRGNGSASSVTGSGQRMMWIPNKAAFRAGLAYSVEWNDSLIGLHSMAFGEAPIASGFDAFASGLRTVSSGNYTTAMGALDTASAQAAVALGQQNAATGNYAVAIGVNAKAYGSNSVSIGTNNIVSNTNAAAIGLNNVIDHPGTYLFGIGNSSGGNGSTSMYGLGQANNLAQTGALALGSFNQSSGYYATTLGWHDTASGHYSMALGYAVSTNNMSGSVLIGDGSTAFSMQSLTPNEFKVRAVGGVRLVTNGLNNIDMLEQGGSMVLSGSTNLLTTGAGTRLEYVAGRGALHVGEVDGSQWGVVGTSSAALGHNPASRGYSSMAFGYDVTANGNYSVALDSGTTASAPFSVAMGEGSRAFSNASLATGIFTQASGTASSAFGSYSISSNTNAMAAGNYARAIGTNSMAFGDTTYATSEASLATGYHTTANANYSTAMGSYASTSGRAGSFIYGDASTTATVSNGVDNEFKVRATGGVQLITTAGNSSSDVSITNGSMQVANNIQSKGVYVGVTAVGGNYTATSTDYTILANASGGNVTVTLPPATNKGQLLVVTKADGAPTTVTVAPAGTDAAISASGLTTTTTQGSSITLVADGTSTWFVIAHQ